MPQYTIDKTGNAVIVEEKKPSGSDPRKKRSWYLHEVLIFLAWGIIMGVSLSNNIGLWITNPTLCYLLLATSIIAIPFRRKNETLPTGGGAWFVNGINVYLGGLFLIAGILDAVGAFGVVMKAGEKEQIVLTAETFIHGLISRQYTRDHRSRS